MSASTSPVPAGPAIWMRPLAPLGVSAGGFTVTALSGVESMLRISGVPWATFVGDMMVALVACGVVNTPSPWNEAYRKLSAPLDPVPVERRPAARNTSVAFPGRTRAQLRPVSTLR